MAAARAYADNLMPKSRNFVSEPMPPHAPCRKMGPKILFPTPRRT